MQRGDLFLVTRSGIPDPRPRSKNDPRTQCVFVVVSRQVLIDSKFSSVCAPLYSRYDGLRTQVTIGVDDGLKHASSIHCDELASLPKSRLTDFIGHLNRTKVEELGRALPAALDLDLMLVPPGDWLQ